ncbi:MAG: 50S ribosomal protein L9 [bacterium]|nr:50S ribosomal protein L9 [bacterium]
MEVLLLQDLPGIGKKNDLLVVGDGYAMNNLLPNRMALVATPTVRRRYAEQIRRRAVEKVSELATQADSASSLKGKTLTFERKATKAGKLYAAITEKVLSEELKTQLTMDIKADAIVIGEPIKSLGDFEVKIKMADAEHALAVAVVQEK